MRPGITNLRSKMTDIRFGRADPRPERRDFRHERADFKPEKAYFRPKRPDWGEKWMDGWKNGEIKVLSDFVPFGAATQKRMLYDYEEF